MRINVEMSETQAKIVMRALDLFSRLHMGQVGELEVLFRSLRSHGQMTFPGSDIRRLCDEIKAHAFLGLGRDSYYAISSGEVSEDARIAWDLIQALRQPIAMKKHPEGGMTVDFDPPEKTAIAEDLAKVQVE